MEPARPPTAKRAVEWQHYLDAVIEASKRTRFVTITAAIASVMVLAGHIGSIRHQWMLERIWAFSDSGNTYVESKLGQPPDPRVFPRNGSAENPALKTYEQASKEYDLAYRSFYDALVKAYVDALTTRTPLFGFGIDANDLGLIGGLSFIVILLMYRFSLGREIDNLRIARSASARFEQALDCYLVLAMNQMFTVPRSPDRTRRNLHSWAPRWICLSPLIVESIVMLHHLATFEVGDEISTPHNLVTMYAEALAVILLILLSAAVLKRLYRMDEIWDTWWEEVKPPSANGAAVAPTSPR